MIKKIRLSLNDVNNYHMEKPDFPKYTTQIINLANQNSQATRPRHVGQMSELIRDYPGNTLKEWESWYKEIYPNTIDNATDKILLMVKNLKSAIQKIDRKMVRKWVEDLIINKTFVGMGIQQRAIKAVAEAEGVTDFSFETDPSAESKGIDGYLNGVPVSVKPLSYNQMKNLPEKIPIGRIYYIMGEKELEIAYSDQLMQG